MIWWSFWFILCMWWIRRRLITFIKWYYKAGLAFIYVNNPIIKQPHGWHNSQHNKIKNCPQQGWSVSLHTLKLIIIIEVGMLTLELYSYLLKILNGAVLIYNTQSNSDWLFNTQSRVHTWYCMESDTHRGLYCCQVEIVHEYYLTSLYVSYSMFPCISSHLGGDIIDSVLLYVVLFLSIGLTKATRYFSSAW